MNKTSSYWSETYVSCIKINGKSILPPLMTPQRRAEMCHYKQMAMAVEARLPSSTRKKWNNESVVEDSSVTMLSGTECASSNHNFCTGTTVDGNSTCEMEPTLILSGESASLSNAVIKKLMPSNELEKRILRTADIRSKSAIMLENFHQYTVEHHPLLVLDPFQQHVIHKNCSSEVENVGQCITVDARRKGGLCSDSKDSSVQDSNSEGVLVNDDITDHGKCCLENVQQDPRLILTKNIFSPNYTGFRPWTKVHNGNTSNECDMVLKTCQGIVSSLSGNQQETKQVVTDSDVNTNMVEIAVHSLDKNGSHHSFIMPVIQNVNHKPSSVSDTDDNGQKCGAINDTLESRTECESDKECMSQDENHSKNPLEPVKLQPEVNCTFPSHSQKTANPNVPVHNISYLSKETHEAHNVSEPGKICEESLDISKGLQSEYCCSDDCVRLNSLGSDRNILMNKYVSSGHSSPGHTEFPDVTSDMPHLLPQENLEDSVSSVAMTSSTDLTHYMNITGSSDSGSPGQDFAAYSSKLSGQDIYNNASSMAAWHSPSLSENSVGGQNLQSASCSESTLISCHSSLSGDKAQDTIQNVVDNTMGSTSRQDSVCVVEKFVVQSDSSEDLRVSYPMNIDCAVCPTKNSHTACENMNCHVSKPAECLSVPKLKLQCNKSVHGHDDLDTSVSLVSRCVQESNSAEKSLNAVSGRDIPEPETPHPKLVRQNSYTLDVPSPLLVAHIEMQKEQNSIYDMTGSLNLSPKPCRKAWDLAKAKSKWKLGRKKSNSLFAVLNQKDKPNNKINCDDTISSRCAFLAGGQDHHISSLPASNASSPVKVLTTFASLDSLPLAISIEAVKTFPQPSTPRQSKGSCIASISSTATIVTNRSRTSQKKSPASNTSRSAKPSTPSALLDGLPSVSPKNTLKSPLQPSAQMKNKDSSKCNILSTPTKQSSNRSRTCQNKSPAKTLMKNLPIANSPVASQDKLKKISDFKYVPLSSQQDIRRLIQHMQSEHHQQMADLLAKQRLEQEKLREAFLQQQEQLVLEIRKVYSTALCASDSQKPLAQQTPPRDYLANHENGSLNSSINPFHSGLSSKSLSFENSGTSVTSMCDVTDQSTLLDTNLERFLTITSASTEKGQTVTGNGLYKDSVQDKASNDMTAHLHKSSHETMTLEEVPQNPLQNCNSVIFSDSNSIERYLPVDSSHQSPELSVPPQLGKLQKHNSNSGEETTKIRVDTRTASSAVPCLSSTCPRTPSSVAASGTVSLPVTVNHVLQRAEADFAPSCIPNIPPVYESGSVEVTEGRNNDIKGRSPCIRQLFPSRAEAADLHPKHPPSRSELEQIAATRITAGARGFLTRRLLRTARVQDLIVTIRDTVLCALKVHQDFWSSVTPEDVALHGRLIQQVTAACHELHRVFFNLSTSEKMAIIAADRDRLRNRTPRPLVPRPLSAATRRAIERKMLQSQGVHFPQNRPASASCILHRRKSTGSVKCTHSGISEVGQSFLLKQQQTTQPQITNKIRHSLNTNCGRRPWR